MGSAYAKTMFTSAVHRLQERYRSRAQYARMAESGASHDALSAREREFIEERDSFYLASVSSDGWPYVQHRGGPKGFLRVLDDRRLAFPDFRRNRQYITTGNVATDDRVSLFLMSYGEQARLKIIGHMRVVEMGSDAELERKAGVGEYAAGSVERVVVIEVVGFDWNCSQYITPRYTQEEIEAAFAGRARGTDGALS